METLNMMVIIAGYMRSCETNSEIPFGIKAFI